MDSFNSSLGWFWLKLSLLLNDEIRSRFTNEFYREGSKLWDRHVAKVWLLVDSSKSPFETYKSVRLKMSSIEPVLKSERSWFKYFQISFQVLWTWIWFYRTRFEICLNKQQLCLWKQILGQNIFQIFNFLSKPHENVLNYLNYQHFKNCYFILQSYFTKISVKLLDLNIFL